MHASIRHFPWAGPALLCAMLGSGGLAWALPGSGPANGQAAGASLRRLHPVRPLHRCARCTGCSRCAPGGAHCPCRAGVRPHCQPGQG